MNNYKIQWMMIIKQLLKQSKPLNIPVYGIDKFLFRFNETSVAKKVAFIAFFVIRKTSILIFF